MLPAMDHLSSPATCPPNAQAAASAFFLVPGDVTKKHGLNPPHPHFHGKNDDNIMMIKPHIFYGVPSGKLSHNYGKSQFLIGKSTINGHFQ